MICRQQYKQSTKLSLNNLMLRLRKILNVCQVSCCTNWIQRSNHQFPTISIMEFQCDNLHATDLPLSQSSVFHKVRQHGEHAFMWRFHHQMHPASCCVIYGLLRETLSHLNKPFLTNILLSICYTCIILSMGTAAYLGLTFLSHSFLPILVHNTPHLRCPVCSVSAPPSTLHCACFRNQLALCITLPQYHHSCKHGEAVEMFLGINLKSDM